MSKAVSISFPVKSAAELASHLGVSKARTKRIFAIVDKALAKNGSHVKFSKKEKAKGPTVVKYTVRTSRSGQLSNAKTARTTR